jgi:hypothetical protein
MVLGTAILIVVYAGSQDLAAFRHGWVFIVIVAAATALTGLLMATRRNAIDDHRPVSEPVAT